MYLHDSNQRPIINPLIFVSAFAFFEVPLSQNENWHHLNYSGITPNVVAHQKNSLSIKVNGSSSPLFFAFKKTVWVNQVSLSGKLSSLPKLASVKDEGQDDNDDFALRLGLVIEGNHSLNWLEKIFAPKWLTQLADLAPDKNFEKVHFLTISQHFAPGTQRKHPFSDYFQEEVMLKTNKRGPFKVTYKVEPPKWAFGLWIQSDGDNTKSQFELVIDSLVLSTKPASEETRDISSEDP